MWTKSHTIVSPEVTARQLWKLFADVNNWYLWDQGIEYARLEGPFEKGNSFLLKPKGGPRVKIKLVEADPARGFTDLTVFPGAKMYGEHRWESSPGGLKITTTMRISGPLAFFWRRVVAEKIAAGLPVEMPGQVKFASKL